ncbi:ATP-binding mismatch repair protein [Sporothrix epigloea]|uniref:ATP-binding mismatch repair protein n=1 Tax=Sporothrix epigloea TaxID=1892477 RepID=A0ABP0DLT7_9PEZI
MAATSEVEPPASVTIKAIDASAVHRIQSGQVIVNLCSVAKELVENSLDAGATSIEVRFKNQGLDAIEVQDNGMGIAPHNYASLALKHYTSKLSSFDDLDTLQTFGFRGEALSSLCALSRFAVVTCLAEDVPKGTRLAFETSGQLGEKSVVAAQRGTTVTVENLFWNLPVRRRELERNIKREWAKVIGLLNQYACIQTGVKLTVSQQPSKGKKVILFSTRGNAATRDNIINVFGTKTMTALLALDLELEMAITKSQWAADALQPTTNRVYVRGFVSRPAHGQGRQTPDRQMFHVNGRPCKLPQFAQLFGEVYRSYNSGQSPFIFADIQLDTHLYDVNVSPDKQTILLHDQGRMLDTLRESLIELFEKQDITVPISQLTSQRLIASKKAALPSSSVAAPIQSTSVKKPINSSPTAPSLTAPSLSNSVTASSNFAGSGAEASEEDSMADEPVAQENSPEAASGNMLDEALDEPGPPSPASPSIPKKQLLRAGATDTGLQPGSRKRLPDNIATVNIGSATTSVPVLTSSGMITKRQKTANLYRGASIQATQSTMKAANARLPSFGGRLSQKFSAARRSSQSEEQEVDGDNNIDVEDEDQDQDENKNIETNNEGEGGDIFSEDSVEAGSQEESIADKSEISDNREVDEIMDDAGEEDVDEEVFTDDAENNVSNNDQFSPTDEVRQHEALTNHNHIEEYDANQEEQDSEDEYDKRARNSDDSEYDSHPAISAEPPISTDEEKRNSLFLKSGGSKKRHEALQLVQILRVNERSIRKLASSWHSNVATRQEEPIERNDNEEDDGQQSNVNRGGLDDTEAVAVAEAKLALTISKDDFAKMRIVGQFNLGFILAVREASSQKGPEDKIGNLDDELFIIDQHASDEKYNFERLQASTVVQSQRLVQPKRLELTAVEEEIVLEHLPALATNGFAVEAVLDGSEPVGNRCRLRTLPLSRETTFDLTDLEELIALLGDHHHHHHHDDGDNGSIGHLTAVPRPAKVRKMFAMRACRSSIMIGKALSRRQMASVLAHMGEMDKPWNCPHGRPTMRHLCSLGAAWDETGRSWGPISKDYSNTAGSDYNDSQSLQQAEWNRFLGKRR